MVIITGVLVLSGTYTIVRGDKFFFLFDLPRYLSYYIIVLKIGMKEKLIQDKFETK